MGKFGKGVLTIIVMGIDGEGVAGKLEGLEDGALDATSQIDPGVIDGDVHGISVKVFGRYSTDFGSESQGGGVFARIVERGCPFWRCGSNWSKAFGWLRRAVLNHRGR
jgi:hypothetical protein